MADRDEAELMASFRQLRREWVELLQRAGALEDRMVDIRRALGGRVSLPHPLLGGTRFTDVFTETEPDVVEADPMLLPAPTHNLT